MASAPYQDLIPLGRSLPVRVYLRSLWERRQFAITVPLGELRAQHMNTVLGNVWHLLNPMLQVAVYYLIFGVLLGTNRGVDNFITYLAIGVFSYGYMQRSVTACASAIINNEGLIRSLSFPRAILPISAVMREMIGFSSSIVLMLLVALATGEGVSWGWLLILPWTLAMGLFSLGLGFVLARLTDSFHDLRNLLPFLFRLVFYMSGILYSFGDLLRRRGVEELLPLVPLNPFYDFISQMRAAVMTTNPTDPVVDAWTAPVALLFTVVFLVFGFLYFRGAEQRYGRG